MRAEAIRGEICTRETGRHHFIVVTAEVAVIVVGGWDEEGHDGRTGNVHMSGWERRNEG